MITIFQESNYVTILGLERHKDDKIYNFSKKMSVYVEDADSFVIKNTFNNVVAIIPFEEVVNGNVIDNSITPVPYTVASLRTFLRNCTSFNSAGSIPDSVSLTLNGNTLEILDDEGNVIAFQDLSVFLDDTNLARVVSVSVDPTGLATFTRDDGSTFTGDLSVLIDDTNLERILSGSIVGNNIELVRGDGSIIPIDITGLIDLQNDVTQNAADISALQIEQVSQQLEIDTNTANIATLQSDVTTLQSQVAASVTDIVNLQAGLTQEIADRIAGDAAIQSQVTVNAAGVASNTASIVTNVTGIATNAASIITNAGDISDNAADILALQSEDVNLQAQITANDADISQEVADRIAGDAALQAQITSNDADIAQNAADIAQEVIDRALADTALQVQVTDNETDITSLQAQVSSNDADISALQAADTALQTQITSNDGDITALQAGQVVQDTAIALNTAKVSFPEAPLDGQQYLRQNGNWIPFMASVKEFFQSTPSAAQNGTTITPTDALLQTTENKNSNATVFDLQSGLNLVINKTGNFKFTVNVGGDTATGAREELTARLQRDSGGGFVDIPLTEGATQGYSYHRNNAAGRDILKIDVILAVTSGDAFRVVLNSPTNGVDIINIGTNLIIEEK